MKNLSNLLLIGTAALVMVACSDNDDDDNNVMPVDNSSVPDVMQPDPPVIVDPAPAPVVDEDPVVVAPPVVDTPDTPVVVDPPVAVDPPVEEPVVDPVEEPVVDPVDPVDPVEEPVVDEPVAEFPIENDDGTLTLEDGAIVQLDGSILNPDGSVTNTDGTITNPDGVTLTQPDGSITDLDGNPIDDTGVLEGQAVAFVEADIFNTVTVANAALSPTAIVEVREGVTQLFPDVPMDGTGEAVCESGDARATNSGITTMYEFNNCLVGGNLLNGTYQVVTSTEERSGDTRFKFDDDFDLTVEQEGRMVTLIGNSKLETLSADLDGDGSLEITQSVLRTDFSLIEDSGVVITNLTSEDIVTRELDPLGGIMTTLALSGSSPSVFVTTETGDTFDISVNRNGVIVTDGLGDFVDSEGRNAMVQIYNAASDRSITATVTGGNTALIETTIDSFSGESAEVEFDFTTWL